MLQNNSGEITQSGEFILPPLEKDKAPSDTAQLCAVSHGTELRRESRPTFPLLDSFQQTALIYQSGAQTRP